MSFIPARLRRLGRTRWQEVEVELPGGADHDHAGIYADADHAHEPGGEHPDRAAHEALGLAADDHGHDTTHDHDGVYADDGHDHDTSHNHDSAYAAPHGHPYADDDHAHPALTDPDIPASIARDSEVTAAIAAHVQAETHGAESSEAYAVGDLYLTETNFANPAAVAARHGYGEWALTGQGRVLMGVDAGQEGGDTGGSADHSHAGHTDHAALTHAGATVGNHTFTQPNAHSDHGALSHSGATVGDHAALAHSAHAGATVGNHTDVVNHTHLENINTATTGGNVGFPALKDTSTSGSEATALQTGNPVSGGVAAQVHTVGQASAHSDHATQSHSVGQASQHAAQSHSAHAGGAVDAHSVGQANQHAAQSHSAHDTASNLPPFLAVYIWKRTA